MRPLIGITTRLRDVQTSAGVAPSHTLNRDYSDAVLRAGGTPVLLTPVPDDEVPHLVARIDGLLLTGGGDVAPERYGARRHDSMYGIDPERDAFELALAAAAAAALLPTLAVCRGLQVVNVALGGSLVTDLPSAGKPDHARTGEHVYERYQRVTMDPGCRVALALGGTEVWVNSIHHQAVDRLGTGLRVVGRADDGVPEVIQSDDPAWPLLAVQWHPEYLQAREPAAVELFRALVEAAAVPVR